MTMAMMNGHCDDDVHDDNDDDNIYNNDVSKMTVIISLIIPLWLLSW